MIALLVLGVVVVSALFAYVPLVLVIRHSRLPKEERGGLLKRYVEEDTITTAEYIAEVEKEWDGRDHAPLR